MISDNKYAFFLLTFDITQHTILYIIIYDYNFCKHKKDVNYNKPTLGSEKEGRQKDCAKK